MTLESEKPMRLSQWAHLFYHDDFDHFAIYHSLNIETIFLENNYKWLIDAFRSGTTQNALIDKLTDMAREDFLEVYDELVRTEIIVPAVSDDMDCLIKKKSEVISPPHLETLYLLVTDECNLRCKYCLINNCLPQVYSKTFMTWNIAKTAVDMFFANLLNNPTDTDDSFKNIIFYGGEPLLNFDVIKKVVEYVKSTYQQRLVDMDGTFRFSVITNGTAITNEVALFLGKHEDVSVTISLDGSKEVNDKKRVTTTGNGSFDMAIKGLNILKEAGGRSNVAISCTIDDHNIEHLSELLELQSEYEFTAINLNPLLETNAVTVDGDYTKNVSNRMLEYFVLARDKGVYEERVMRKVLSFVNKTIHAFDCQATGTQVVCSPDGKIGTCQEGLGNKNFFFGDVGTNWSFFEEPVLSEWGKRTPLNMPQCYHCPALGICGGGCTYNAWLKNGSIWSLDDKFCVHSLTTLEWLIWDLYATL